MTKILSGNSIFFSAFFAIGLSAVPAMGQQKPRTPAPKTVAEPTAPSTYRLNQARPRNLSGIDISMSAGSANYQDIQAPVASNGGDLRIDGTTTKPDSTEHNGIMLGARLSWSAVHTLGNGTVGITGLRTSRSAPIDGPASSYQRISIDAGSAWTIVEDLNLLTAIDLRRSSFLNADNGHYVDSIVLKAGAELKMRKFAALATMGTAPMSQFGYTKSTGSGSSGTLSNTTTSLSEWDGRVAWDPSKDSSLFLSMSQENISVKMSDVGGYQRLGFRVLEDDSEATEKNYNLSTTSISIGATRKF